MNRRPSTESLLHTALPPVPPAEVPDIAALQNRVSKRRRRRKWGTFVSCSVAVAIGLAVVSRWNQGNEPAPLVQPGQAVSGEKSSRALAGQTQPVIFPVDHDVAQVGVDETNDIRVFARVIEQSPVFDVHPQTKVMRHVGWIESEQTVPLDLRFFSDDQRQDFRAMLRPNAQSVPLSL